jgi:hypothetical protein
MRRIIAPWLSPSAVRRASTAGGGRALHSISRFGQTRQLLFQRFDIRRPCQRHPLLPVHRHDVRTEWGVADT